MKSTPIYRITKNSR